MTARQRFQQIMTDRRKFPKHSADWQWRTRAARKLAWLMMGRPVEEWTE